MMMPSILVIAGVTYLLRIMPFVLLGKQTHTPEWIVFLDKVYPPLWRLPLRLYCIFGSAITSLASWVVQ